MDALWQNRAEYNMALERAVDLAERGERAAAGVVLLGEVRPRQSLMFQSLDDSRALQKQFADTLAQDASRSAALATLALAENPNGYVMGSAYQLPASPRALVKLLAQQSGCFRVVDRSAGLARDGAGAGPARGGRCARTPRCTRAGATRRSTR